ncbi:hypothetical protein [Paracidovorax konjaci]|uniref:Uncharacterized protein n=1 Tax=Paracidovorax konjaci TaxID=32040 RepID=A0A1I1TEC2_9BURK|nr:hypothetical protein [Paracidovorax konjaci]SFD54673.1 hypothetical protein SAMN04489710_103190 [Paracidovorax konjaci]
MDVAPVSSLLPEEARPARPAGWGDSFRMPLFRSGTQVRLGDRWETVSHVSIRRQDMSVHLVGRDAPVAPERLVLEPTVFATRRMP